MNKVQWINIILAKFIYIIEDNTDMTAKKMCNIIPLIQESSPHNSRTNNSDIDLQDLALLTIQFLELRQGQGCS